MGPTAALLAASLAVAPAAAAGGRQHEVRLPESLRTMVLDEALARRMRESVDVYYRRFNVPVSEAVCQAFAGEMSTIPKVRLHGDAHVEQYTVTAHSAGLSDFDDSSTGPGVIDLVRFAASLHLACEGLSCDSASLVDAFLRGYRDALRNPDVPAPPPATADRLRQRLLTDRGTFLDRATALMTALPPAEEARVRAALGRWAQEISGREPGWPKDFFTIRAIGYHEEGVGSYGEPKWIARIEGPTSVPDDDIVVEAKALRDLTGVSCIEAPRGDALRVLAGHLHIGKRRDPFLAVVPRDPKEPATTRAFWVQSWSPSYAELSLADPALTAKELQEIARDVGIQLGQGHVCHSASPALRTAQATWLRRHEGEVRRVAREVAAAVIAAWSDWRRPKEPQP